MTYSIEILKSAQKTLSRINEIDRNRIIEAVRSLAQNPRPNTCIKLTSRSAWRIRIGNYRVVYEIHDKKLQIVVITIGHRKHVY